jgi:hypothetical protein
LIFGTFLSHGAASPTITASDSPKVSGGVMIKFLAQIFRGFHYIVGISAPPPGTSDRTFVFAWLGGVTFFVAFFMILVYYIIPSLYFRH